MRDENLLLITWTLVEAVLPTLGWQEYSPESARLDCCTNRNEEVVEPAVNINLIFQKMSFELNKRGQTGQFEFSPFSVI